MIGYEAGDVPDVYNGAGDIEVEVEAIGVDLLLEWHGGGVREVLVAGVDVTGGLDDR